MKLTDLQHVQTTSIPPGQSYFRVQRSKLSKSTVLKGPLKLAPPGRLAGRFDLSDTPCAYLAEAPETALYEAVFRREASLVSLSSLANQELVAVQTCRAISVADLRPHAGTWPVLQSLRLSETQELASELQAAGFDGAMYRSAQQYGYDCIALFGPSASLFKGIRVQALADSAGRLNKHLAQAALHSRVPLGP
jgi:hypothetical protein